MPRPGIELRSPGPLANTLTIMPMSVDICYNPAILPVFVIFHIIQLLRDYRLMGNKIATLKDNPKFDLDTVCSWDQSSVNMLLTLEPVYILICI